MSRTTTSNSDGDTLRACRGYLTNGGEFLNRDQAWNRAKEVGQRDLVRAQGRASGIMELHFRAI